MKAELDLTGPQRFGSYVLKERLGCGGMGDVFRAERQGVGGFVKTVALKRILPHLLDDHDFVKMFVGEARVAASLEHANIVSTHDFGEHEGQLYLVMELVRGQSLLSTLCRLENEERALPFVHSLFVILEVCKALRVAHERCVGGVPAPVVHRDINPQNILISYAGEVKITDFGVAKAQERIARAREGGLEGKLCFMAPEQVREEQVDARCDIFASGVVLYEMLTGKNPFAGGTQAETALNVLQKEIAPPSSLRSELSEEIDRIVLRALERDKQQRYQHIVDLGRDISRFLTNEGLMATGFELADFIRELFYEHASEWAEVSSPDAVDASLGGVLAKPGKRAKRSTAEFLSHARDHASRLERKVEDGVVVDFADDPSCDAGETVKDLAGEVVTRNDVDLWAQIALLDRMSEGSTVHYENDLFEALVAAAAGRFAVSREEL